MEILAERRLLLWDPRGGRGVALAKALTRLGAMTSIAGGAVEHSMASLGEVHALVLLPLGRPGPEDITTLSAADWDERVTSPLRSTILSVRGGIDHWISDGTAGDIVVVHAAGPATGASRALHSGLVAFVRSVAKEYGRRRIRCNLVSIADDASATDDGGLAGTIGFLLSPAASFVTGQVLTATPGPP